MAALASLVHIVQHGSFIPRLKVGHIPSPQEPLGVHIAPATPLNIVLVTFHTKPAIWQ